MTDSKHELKNSNFSNWQFILMMSVAVVVWAFAFPFIKIGLNELSFVNLTIMRFFIVCVVLLTIIILQPRRFSKLQKKDIIPIFLLGFFGVMVYHLGLNYGEQFISPGAASLIIATSPIQIVILATIFLKEKLTLKKFLGTILALSGVIIISVWGEKNVSLELKYIYAALAVLIAAVMTALYTIAGKKLLERYSGLSLTTYAMLLGSIGLIPFLLPDFSILGQVSQMSLTAWFAVIFLGVFSTVIGYVIWYVVLKIKTASEVSIYLYAIPVLSTIISYVLFQDEITLFFILGGLLVIIGLIIVNRNKQKID
jgi:drug/metabolite transporter (DMT)-like permease